MRHEAVVSQCTVTPLSVRLACFLGCAVVAVGARERIYYVMLCAPRLQVQRVRPARGRGVGDSMAVTSATVAGAGRGAAILAPPLLPPRIPPASAGGSAALSAGRCRFVVWARSHRNPAAALSFGRAPIAIASGLFEMRGWAAGVYGRDLYRRSRLGSCCSRLVDSSTTARPEPRTRCVPPVRRN